MEYTGYIVFYLTVGLMVQAYFDWLVKAVGERMSTFMFFFLVFLWPMSVSWFFYTHHKCNQRRKFLEDKIHDIVQTERLEYIKAAQENKLIAVLAENGDINIINVESGKVLRTIPKEQKPLIIKLD